jgi:mycothiol synthase
MHGPAPVPEPARPEEWAEVFRLLFAGRDPRDRDDLVANALALLRRGEIDPDGLLVVRGSRGLIGAVACQPVPGRSGILFPPHTSPDQPAEALEDALLGRAIAWLRERGARLAQVMLADGEAGHAPALLRNGFSRMTVLVYLSRDLAWPLPEKPSRRLDFIPYNREDPVAFRETLARTWQDSADCPELHGVLTVEDALAGHEAQGPGQWWLVEEQGRPVGVVITVTAPDGPRRELAYLGVVPEARGRGVGREMLRETLARARAAGAREMTLCVDERNAAAFRLYRECGFEPFDWREVYLAIWQ